MQETGLIAAEVDQPQGDFLEALTSVGIVITAVVVAGIVWAGFKFFSDLHSAQVTAAIVEEFLPVACISQSRPSERAPEPVCASGTTTPATELRRPVAAAQVAFWMAE